MFWCFDGLCTLSARKALDLFPRDVDVAHLLVRHPFHHNNSSRPEPYIKHAPNLIILLARSIHNLIRAGRLRELTSQTCSRVSIDPRRLFLHFLALFIVLQLCLCMYCMYLHVLTPGVCLRDSVSALFILLQLYLCQATVDSAKSDILASSRSTDSGGSL